MGLFDDFAKQVIGAAQTLAEGSNSRLAQGFLEVLQQRGGIDGLIAKLAERNKAAANKT